MYEKITDCIYALFPGGYSSNVYLVTGKRPALIDVGCGNLDVLLKDLEEIGYAPTDIKDVFLTHGHYDHIANAEPFATAETYMHGLDARKVEDGDVQFTVSISFTNNPYFVIPKHYLEDGQAIKIGDLEAKVLHCPGHTAGCVAFYVPLEKVLFSGDVIFPNKNIGRFDLPTGNYDEQMKSVERLRKLDFEWLLSGHGYERLA